MITYKVILGCHGIDRGTYKVGDTFTVESRNFENRSDFKRFFEFVSDDGVTKVVPKSVPESVPVAPKVEATIDTKDVEKAPVVPTVKDFTSKKQRKQYKTR